MSRAVRRRLQEAVTQGARFSVTLELVQGHGWKGELTSALKSGDDGYKVSVDSLRGSWKGNIARRR